MACSSKRRPSVSGVLTLPTTQSYTWSDELKTQSFSTPPLSAFKNAPLSLSCGTIQPGLVVEVANPFAKGYVPGEVEPFWQASIVKVMGYKILLRLHNEDEKLQHEFWRHIGSHLVQPVGWCLANKRDLVPPDGNTFDLEDLKKSLMAEIEGKKTLDKTEINYAFNSKKSIFEKGKILEVTDPDMLNVVRVGVVLNVFGDRLEIGYFNENEERKTAWHNERSPFIHPVGWAHKLELTFVASASYKDRVSRGEYIDRDCFWDMFPQFSVPVDLPVVGMKLEAVDLRRPDRICVATVKKVLRFGYLMICIDGEESEDSWFCTHTSSPLIFPPGFCHKFNISLSFPGHIKGFSWSKYLKETESQAVPSKSLNQRTTSSNQFQVGMKMEAVSITSPDVLEVATVVQIASRLVKLRFSSQGKADIWMDCESPDLYPVGWSEFAGLTLKKPDPKENTTRTGPQQFQNFQRTKPTPKRFQIQPEADKEGASNVANRQIGPKESSPSFDDIEITFESVDEIEVAAPAAKTNTTTSYLANPELTTAEVENSSVTSPNIRIFKLNKIVDDGFDRAAPCGSTVPPCEVQEGGDSTPLENEKDDILSDDISLLVANAISDEVLGDSVASSPTKIPSSNITESEHNNSGQSDSSVDSTHLSATIKAHPAKRKLYSTKIPGVSEEKRGRGPSHQSPSDIGNQILKEKVKLEVNKQNYKY